MLLLKVACVLRRRTGKGGVARALVQLQRGGARNVLAETREADWRRQPWVPLQTDGAGSVDRAPKHLTWEWRRPCSAKSIAKKQFQQSRAGELAIATFLGEAGFRVETCHDGQAAEQWLRHLSFDLILLDLGLPNLDGIHVLRRQIGRAHV